MSLILDALNRAEQERKRQDQVPDIHTIHLAPAMSLEAAARTRRKLLIASGVVVLVVIIGSSIWILRSPKPGLAEPLPSTSPVATFPSPAPQQNTDAVVSHVDSQVEAKPEQVMAPAPAQEETVVDTAKADINNLYAASQENTVEETNVASPVVDLYKEEVPVASEAVATPFPEAVEEPVVEVKIRSLDEYPKLPFFNDLPWTQKQQVPTISYSRHNYLPNAVSSVVINGATRGVGNLAPGEFIIEDIVSDGIVLRHQDKVFKLPALSGWVNM